MGISSDMVPLFYRRLHHRHSLRSHVGRLGGLLAMTAENSGAALAPSLRGLSKIGTSEPILDWGSVLPVSQPSYDTPSKREVSGRVLTLPKLNPASTFRVGL